MSPEGLSVSTYQQIAFLLIAHNKHSFPKERERASFFLWACVRRADGVAWRPSCCWRHRLALRSRSKKEKLWKPGRFLKEFFDKERTNLWLSPRAVRSQRILESHAWLSFSFFLHDRELISRNAFKRRSSADDHLSLESAFLGVNLLSREGKSQTGLTARP